MADVRFELNSDGVDTILKWPTFLANLEERAERIRQATGSPEDYAVHSRIGANRARAEVVTATFRGMYHEAVDRELTRAIDAGRG